MHAVGTHIVTRMYNCSFCNNRHYRLTICRCVVSTCSIGATCGAVMRIADRSCTKHISKPVQYIALLFTGNVLYNRMYCLLIAFVVCSSSCLFLSFLVTQWFVFFLLRKEIRKGERTVKEICITKQGYRSSHSAMRLSCEPFYCVSYLKRFVYEFRLCNRSLHLQFIAGCYQRVPSLIFRVKIF